MLVTVDIPCMFCFTLLVGKEPCGRGGITHLQNNKLEFTIYQLNSSNMTEKKSQLLYNARDLL